MPPSCGRIAGPPGCRCQCLGIISQSAEACIHRASIGFFTIAERSSICLCLSLTIKWGRWVVRQKIQRLLLISVDQALEKILTHFFLGM